jgi:ATP-dependent Clp protease protease subunit
MNLPELRLPARPKGLRFEARAVEEPLFGVRAEGSPTISIFDSIGGEVTTARIAGALRLIGPQPITVEINSLGGDVFEGIGIYNVLRRHPAAVTVQILGIAASAASVIAMAGERIEIAPSAEIMIHNSRGVVAGSRADMRSFAEVLEQLDRSMATLYASRTGLPEAEAALLMDAETFFPANDAIALGFADALLPSGGAARPKALAGTAPTSKRDLEAQLRTLGLSRAQAARAAAASWPAIRREELDLDQIAARLDAHSLDLKRLA